MQVWIGELFKWDMCQDSDVRYIVFSGDVRYHANAVDKRVRIAHRDGRHTFNDIVNGNVLDGWELFAQRGADHKPPYGSNPASVQIVQRLYCIIARSNGHNRRMREVALSKQGE